MHTSQYYRILTDPSAADQWFLGEPLTADGHEIDAREFTDGKPYRGPVPVTLRVAQPGKEARFNLAAFDLPIVSADIALAIQDIAPAGVECFPVNVPRSRCRYVILNVIRCEDCLNEKLSKVMKWRAEDARPEKTGQYRMITNLTVDPLRAHDQHVFRIEGWEIALIVSRQLKERIENIEGLGIVFSSV